MDITYDKIAEVVHEAQRALGAGSWAHVQPWNLLTEAERAFTIAKVSAAMRDIVPNVTEDMTDEQRLPALLTMGVFNALRHGLPHNAAPAIRRS